MLVIKFLYHFYGLGCCVCTDQTGTFTDVSLADPWTLSYEFTKSLGGATCYCQNSKGFRRF
jgi:hypothetical protein